MPLFHNANNYYKIAQYPANIKNFGNNGLLKTSSVLIYLTFMEKNWKMEKFIGYVTQHCGYRTQCMRNEFPNFMVPLFLPSDNNSCST